MRAWIVLTISALVIELDVLSIFKIVSILKVDCLTWAKNCRRTSMLGSGVCGTNNNCPMA